MFDIYIIAKIGKTVRKFKANSFVKNFLMALYSSLLVEYVSLVDVTGSVISETGIICRASGAWCNGGYLYSNTPGRLRLNAPEGDATYGIVVGTGTTPVTPDDYKLEQQIPHGSDDNQLYHYPCNVLDLKVEGNKVIQKIQRQFENRGTVDIDINEIGLQALVIDSGGTTYKVLIARDVLPEPIMIPSGGTAVFEVWIVTTV